MMGGLFTFALFAMFVVLSLLIVVIGVDGYKGVVDTGDSTNELRTSLGYVMNKLHSKAAMDGAAIVEVGGIRTLALTEVNDEGVPVNFYIYHYEGALYETVLYEDMGYLDPEGDTRLTEVASFVMEQGENGLFRFTAVTEDGRTQTVHAAPGVQEGGVRR